MKKYLWLLVVIALLVSSCAYVVEDSEVVIEPEQSTKPSSQLPDTAYATKPGDIVQYEKPTMTSSDDGLWLLGQSVDIVNLYPGCCPDAKMKFTIGNGINDDVAREIYISIKAEDDDDLKGYEQLPAEYYSWFKIDNDYFVLQPGGSRTVTLSIIMPEGTEYSGKKARCELLVLGYTIIGTTVNDKGETVNLVSNVPIGVASEIYIETY